MTIKHTILSALAIFTLISCNSDSKTIATFEEAMVLYNNHCKELTQLNSMSIEQLSKSIIEWKELEDTTLTLSIKDTVKNTNTLLDCASLSNQITDEYVRLVDTDLRSFQDLITFQEMTFSPKNIKDTQVFRNAENFFSEVDLINDPNKIDSPDKTYKEYVAFLEHTYAAIKFMSVNELRIYITKEDFYFNNFISNIHSYTPIQTRTIVNLTNSVSQKLDLSIKKGFMDPSQVTVYMGMRTNRRLIKNAQVCLNRINSGQMKDNEVITATAMILNPYTTVNKWCILCRTDNQVAALKAMGEQTTQAITKLKIRNKDLSNISDSIANHLIKDNIQKYIFD